MSVIQGDMIDYEANVENANSVRDLVLGQLLSDEKITREEFDNYVDNYAVILVRQKWYKRMFGVATTLAQKDNAKKMLFKFVKID